MFSAPSYRSWLNGAMGNCTLVPEPGAGGLLLFGTTLLLLLGRFSSTPARQLSVWAEAGKTRLGPPAHATVVKPKALAERVRKTAEELVKRYEG